MEGIDVVSLGLLLLILIPIAIIDTRERRIPNRLNLLLGLVGLAHAVAKNPVWGQVVLTLFTVLLASFSFVGTAWVVRRLDRNAKIGWGDLKFLIAASLWVGLDGSVAILLLASLCSVSMALVRAPWEGMDLRKLKPFGPFLAVAMLAIVTVLFTHEIIL